MFLDDNDYRFTIPEWFDKIVETSASIINEDTDFRFDYQNLDTTTRNVLIAAVFDVINTHYVEVIKSALPGTDYDFDCLKKDIHNEIRCNHWASDLIDTDAEGSEYYTDISQFFGVDKSEDTVAKMKKALFCNLLHIPSVLDTTYQRMDSELIKAVGQAIDNLVL